MLGCPARYRTEQTGISGEGAGHDLDLRRRSGVLTAMNLQLAGLILARPGQVQIFFLTVRQVMDLARLCPRIKELHAQLRRFLVSSSCTLPFLQCSLIETLPSRYLQ
ncbi:unnamed protein product [Diplocarpon coronariae]|nr:hypothetical protein JHW43_007099 [Diplocarpon mali]